MAKNIPSYLINRNGIYYFQARIPVCHPYRQFSKSKLIRRSTRTGNHREALKIARILWVAMMKDIREVIERDAEWHQRTIEEMKKIGGYDHLSKRDREYQMVLDADERENELYLAGAKIQAEIDKIHPRDDDGMAMHFPALTKKGKMALEFYNEEKTKEDMWRRKEEKETYAHFPQRNQVYMNEASGAVRPPSKMLSALVGDFIKSKADGPENLVPSTIKRYEDRLNLFVEMVGDQLSSGLSLDSITDGYVNRIARVPAGWSKKKKYKSKNRRMPISDIIEMATKGEDALLSPKTIQEYVITVKNFLTWASANGRNYILDEWPVAFEALDKYIKANKGVGSIQADPFNDVQLKLLFENDSYRAGEFFDRPERHWAPLISLYTGARRGDIAKLYLSDIACDAGTGIWYIDIAHDESNMRRTKTKPSIRKVPIHQNIIDLGFLNFLESRKNTNDTQLFPDLKPNRDGEWGDEISTWFNGDGYIKKCGIEAEKGVRLSFHSLRHTFIDYGKQKGLPDKVKDQITGHAPEKHNARYHYEKPFSLETLKEYLDKVQYDIDIGLIKKWQ